LDVSPQRGYAICTTQRTGSNYLCQSLAATGALGRPLDYFNAVGRRAAGWTDFPDDVEGQLQAILAKGATPNGVYGFKLFAYDFQRVAPAGLAARLPGLQWVHLSRANRLDQAISLVLAKQTGQWRSTAAHQAAPAYDRASIEAELEGITRDHAWWRLYFARNGLTPLELDYETLMDDPQRAVGAVAALMGVALVDPIDPSLVDLERQRGAVNQAWRERFIAESAEPSRFPPPGLAEASAPEFKPQAAAGEALWFPAIHTSRPRLTVSIITKNSEARLPRLLDEISAYADQIVVGVDATSTDGALDVAAAGADVIYQFNLPQPGQLAPARMLPFKYATGDWILSLDDDEGMETSFEALLPELLSAPGVTHHHFKRKWVVSEDPAEYLHAAPWHPNWSRRLFRNDASLVWKPPIVHSQYYIVGPGHYEDRTSILHFEPLLCTPQERLEKVEAYRMAGAATTSEDYYALSAERPRRPVSLRQTRPPAARRRDGTVDPVVHELITPTLAPWGSTIVSANLADTAVAGRSLLATVEVKNTGVLAWAPSYAQWPTQEWPMVRLSYHLLDAEGALVERDGERIVLNRYVPPGGSITFVEEFVAPAAPGDYIIEWDMLSEGDCWFAECGGVTLRTALKVVEAPPLEV
jgi:LPS sulfotransferase NodH